MKYCHKCGAQVDEASRFCASCGQSLTVAAAAPTPRAPVRDYARHVNVLGLLLIIWGVLGALQAASILLATLLFGGRLAEHDFAFVGGLLPGLFWVMGLFFAVVAVAAIMAGTGLRNYEPWARTLAIILCILALLRIPFGTALGIYGLWTLLPAEGERHYQQAAAPRS